MWCQQYCESIHFPESRALFIVSTDVSQFLSCQLLYGLLICLLMIWVKVCGCFAEVKLSLSDTMTSAVVDLLSVKVLCFVRVMSLRGDFFSMALSNRIAACCSALNLEPNRNKGQESSQGFLRKRKNTFFKKDSILIT